MTRLRLTPAVRAWLYGIALAVGPLLVGYGLLTEDQAALWIVLVGAILVPGLALANVGERGVTRQPSRRSRL